MPPRLLPPETKLTIDFKNRVPWHRKYRNPLIFFPLSLALFIAAYRMDPCFLTICLFVVALVFACFALSTLLYIVIAESEWWP